MVIWYFAQQHDGSMVSCGTFCGSCVSCSFSCYVSLNLPSSQSWTAVTWVADRSTIWVKWSLGCERDISSLVSSLLSELHDLKHVTLLVSWPLIARQPTPCMLTLISSIRRNSRVKQPMLRETARAAKSPAAPISSPVNSPPLSYSLMSSTSVSHPQHPSPAYSSPHSFLFSRSSSSLWEKMHDLWSSIFNKLLRRKKGEKEWQREGEKRE